MREELNNYKSIKELSSYLKLIHGYSICENTIRNVLIHYCKLGVLESKPTESKDRTIIYKLKQKK